MFNDVAKLVSKVNSGTRDSYGDPIYTETKTEVFVNVKSVTRIEFYTAHEAGFDPQIVFELADYEDYTGQEFVEYESVRYKVIRTYRKTTTIELICAHVDP